MVSEMESVGKNSTSNPVNAVYNMANVVSNPQPVVHSPQSVGIEFVRQYYTILNRAPNLLFRFYSDDSTFIHGCLDKPGESIQYLKGQKQINAKIMSMNFENCHTKIRQVDSMETIGNGVVIQVIGELSNNGQPLRSFLQTFVLTPQSPNKYYVRNDIFRYQDALHDENIGNAGRCSEKNEIESKAESNTQIEHCQVADSSAVEKEFAYKTNGTVNPDELNSVPEKVVPPTSQSEMESLPRKEILETKSSEELNPEEEEDEQVESSLDEIPKASISPSTNEPKTYAGILGRGSQGTNPSLLKNNLNIPVEASGVNYGENPGLPSSAAMNVGGSSVPKPSFPASAVASANTSQQQREYRFQKKAYNRRNDSRESGKNNNDSDSGDGGEHYNSNMKKFPDENQLFIGNLLPDFSEDILHKIFVKYGKIVDIRIHRQKMSNSKNGRNYGFITFENPEVVDQIIAQKPIYHENHRYNVEKKQGKSTNFERNRDRNSSNIIRNNQNIQSNPNIQIGGPRHIQTNVSGGQAGSGNPAGGPRGLGNRGIVGPNYNHSSNNGNNPNINRGQNFQNRNVFNQQQQQQNR